MGEVLFTSNYILILCFLCDRQVVFSVLKSWWAAGKMLQRVNEKQVQERKSQRVTDDDRNEKENQITNTKDKKPMKCHYGVRFY